MNKRVLVVDDTELNRKLAAAILRRFGWQADEASGGQEALDMLTAEDSYQLVLLDIKMPGMSGEEVCKSIRANPLTATLPLIAYTAHALEDEVDSFLSLGFNAVLIKPISLETLEASIEKALGIHTELPENL